MKHLLEKNFINLAILTVIALIVLSAAFTFYNKGVMRQSTEALEQVQLIKGETENTFLNIRNMDISSRGYALMQEESFLFLPVNQARKINQQNFQKFDSLLAVINYSDPENYAAVKNGFETYVNLYEDMVSLLRNKQMDEYKALLAKDYGKHFWTVNERFSEKLFAYLNILKEEAEINYQAAVFRNSLIQILLVLIGLPTLGFVLYRLKKDTQDRQSLLYSLEENNKKYLFNPGHNQSNNARKILENSISNLKKAAYFVNKISEGNYEVRWEELDEQNVHLNKDNLAGRLLFMREEMKKVKEEDRKRLWATEGLSQFSETIRQNQHDISELTFHSLTFLVKYMQAQQGSLFVLEKEEEEQAFLTLAACYAFDRKKWIEKRVEPGEGLIGQTYLEAETVILTEIPQAYTHITSGLGDTTPGCLLIVPMKYNEQVQAIVELASFNAYEAYQIAFLEKAGEFIASAIATAQNNEKTNLLLEQMQAQTEQLRAQEEELRQNMEELEATQEEMHRKEVALEQKLAALGVKE